MMATLVISTLRESEVAAVPYGWGFRAGPSVARKRPVGRPDRGDRRQVKAGRKAARRRR